MSIVGYNDIITLKIRRKDLKGLLNHFNSYYEFSSLIDFLELNPYVIERGENE